MPPRDASSILDRRNERQSALVLGTYVQPNGEDLHVITMPGSSEEIVVTSSAGRVTWAPGAQVMVGRPTGSHEKVIMGNPPPGHAGGSGFSLRSLPAGAKPAKTYFAFYRDTSDDVVLAWLYRDGVFAADRDILSFSDLLDFSVIGRDPAGTVQPGSVAFFSGDPPTTPKVLHVWDPSAAAVHDHEAADGHLLSSCGWLAGWLYWFDSPDHSGATTPYDTVVSLCRSRADFSSIEVVGTVTVPIPGGLASVSWQLQSLQLSTVAAETQIIGLDDVNHEVAYTRGIRISLDGAATAPVAAGILAFGIPGAGGSFRQIGQGADVSIWRRDSTLAADYAQHWPTSPAWSLGYYAHCSSSADLSTAATYGVPDTGTGAFALYLGPAVSPFGASPTVLPVAQHPTIADYPTYFTPGY